MKACVTLFQPETPVVSFLRQMISNDAFFQSYPSSSDKYISHLSVFKFREPTALALFKFCFQRHLVRTFVINYPEKQENVMMA